MLTNKILNLNSRNRMASGSSDETAILNEPISENDVTHKLICTNYRTPTYCDYCSQLLFGLIKQGLKCESKNI